VGFAAACVLFWWLPSILLAFLHLEDSIQAGTLVLSAIALGAFLLGYIVPTRANGARVVSEQTTDLCAAFSFKASISLSVPAFIVAIGFALYRSGVAYGEGNDIPLIDQAILYTHMFFSYMYLASVPYVEGDRRKRIYLVALLLVLPRLIIALHWGRFFVGQTIVVIALIAFARGWARPSFKRMVQLGTIVVMIVFVPAITRGDNIAVENVSAQPGVVQFFKQGSTLDFFQDYKTKLRRDCPPLLVSMTAKVIPYHALRLCTMDVGDARDVPATINSLLTRQESNDLATGTGGIYLLELYLAGGMGAVVVGSLLFGASCRWFVEQLVARSLFTGIWSECLIRSLFAPRNNLGYVYERIPSLVIATLCVVALVKTVEILQKPLPTRIVD
jgi:hypothetical protein